MKMSSQGRRTGPVTETQKNYLTEFLKNNKELCTGRFTAQFTAKKAQEMWQNIAYELNAMPGGSHKDWRQWRRVCQIN